MTLLRLSMLLAAVAVLLILLPMAAVLFTQVLGTADGEPYVWDFTVFWGAAQLALDGQAIAAFDQPTLAQAMEAPTGPEAKKFYWLYPPMYHLVIAPLGWLPFWAAFPVFSLTALAIYLLALRPYRVAWVGGLNFALAAPVVVIGCFNGNNGMLTAGILLLAFHALSQGKDVRAGLLISLLTIKPTLGVLLPLALIAGGHWRAFLWAVIGTVVFVAVATLVFGLDYWSAFLESASEAGDLVRAGDFPLEVTVTWFGTAHALGADFSTALTIQICAMVLCAALLAWAFARPGAWAWKGAFLFMVTPLATPYAHYYEMAFTLAGLVLLTLAGGVRTSVEKALLVALWALPVCVTFLRDPPVVALLAAPLVTALLILAIIRARRAWA